MPPTALVPLVLFTVLFVLVSLYALSASGHFPRASRLPAIAQGSGPLILWGSILLATACVIVALAAAWALIPWYAAVIGGGAGILVAPLVLQWFPDHFVDGKSALVSFACGAAVLAVTLYWLMRA
jgi:hypothetical protein